jgi:murein L,D-transpeptidase YcbB/YkuD
LLAAAPAYTAFGAAQESHQRRADVIDEVTERLRSRIEAGDALGEIVACGDVVYCSCVIPAFYERRGFRPVWVGADGPLPHALDVERAISGADAEGLEPGAYHLRAIRERMEQTRAMGESGRPVDPAALTDLELLITDGFLVYGSHLLGGRVDPERIDSEWHVKRREVDMPQVLEDAIGGSVEAALMGLLPPQRGYTDLKSALRSYRAIRDRGGWPAVGGTAKLERGSGGEEVAALRERLAATGDIEPRAGAEAGPFDEEVERAVIEFQRRQGLATDGVVGPATRAALNVPVEERIEQIEMNMERHRWLPKDLGRRHILVNIADFRLSVVEDGKSVESMRVVVGRRYRMTPVFSAIMTYLVLNPYWEVPPTIAKEDVLPSVRKDVSYLAEKNMRVFDGWGADAVEVDPTTVDWSRVSPGDLSYRFRQDPGPENSLGRIKFMFPNKYQIYLHDTPAKDLFARPERAFSSGCIRVEKPLDLADYLLQGAETWSRERLEAALSDPRERTITLPDPIPVHLLYWTAFVDEDGKVNFRNDIYHRDKPLMVALHELPPGPGRSRDRGEVQMN